MTAGPSLDLIAIPAPARVPRLRYLASGRPSKHSQQRQSRPCLRQESARKGRSVPTREAQPWEKTLQVENRDVRFDSVHLSLLTETFNISQMRS